MQQFSTLALLRKRKELSDDLFRRYWRDVHGVLAARFPGFSSYRQYHLGALRLALGGAADLPPLHGMADVRFSEEAARTTLLDSDISPLIQADEANLFSSSNLFNLDAGASSLSALPGSPTPSMLILLRKPINSAAVDMNGWCDALSACQGVASLIRHDLTRGQALNWDTPGVAHDRQQEIEPEYAVVIHGEHTASTWLDVKTLCEAYLPHWPGRCISGYAIDACYTMVENGQPTELGLRGLDALLTIKAVGATNQRQPALLQRLYGVAPASAP